MKIKFFGLAAILFSTLMLTSCCVIFDLDSFANPPIHGSGNVISEQREVHPFYEVNLKGSGRVILTKGEKQFIEIKTDDNIMPEIETVVRSGRLIISQRNKNINPTILDFFITVEDLRGISISGSADVYGKSRFVSKTFYAGLHGSGDISLDLEASSLESEISGSGSITFTGSTESYNASIRGSGNINASDMEARHVSVDIKGSGDCRVNASDSLSIDIAGSGDVYYKGNPQISSKIRGSGSVKAY